MVPIKKNPALVQIAIIDSDNGLSPVRRQVIIWINDGRFDDV